jgi:rubredoxin
MSCSNDELNDIADRICQEHGETSQVIRNEMDFDTPFRETEEKVYCPLCGTQCITDDGLAECDECGYLEGI